MLAITFAVCLYVGCRVMWVAASGKGFDNGYQHGYEEGVRSMQKNKRRVVMEDGNINDKLWWLREADDDLDVSTFTDDELRSYYAVMHNGELDAEEEAYKRKISW